MSQPTRNLQPRKKDDTLRISLERMRQALASDIAGRQRDWAAEVEDALARVEAAMRLHQRTAHEPDGLLAEVDETRPTLARQADGLRSDYDVFLTQIDALRHEVQRAANSLESKDQSSPRRSAVQDADLVAIRDLADQLLAGLQEHQGAEVQLVLESVNTDIGVGD